MRERDRRKVREVLEQLLAELRAYGVVALEWRTGEDWAGDPAVWVWVVLPADAEARGLWAFDHRESIRDVIREAFLQAELEDVFVYVSFRLADEDRAREDLEVLAA